MAPKRRRNRAPLWIALAAVLALALVGVGVWWFTRPADSFTLRGSVNLKEYQPGTVECMGEGGYADINKGAQVTVTDATGKVVGIGHLGPGKFNGTYCSFPFAVEGVPRGHGFYGITVASERRGTLRFPESQATSEEIKLTLG